MRIFQWLMILSLMIPLAAHAELTPRSSAADSRIKLVTYDPNNIVVVKARYGYQTQIVFAPNEVVQTVSMGDSMAWQAVPVNNNLFIKPIVPSKTDMTVLTNQNSYSFQLDSTHPNVTPTYKLQFIYPDTAYNNHNGVISTAGTFDPITLNWKYSFTGDKTLVPLAAFDNGQFTYFKFNHTGASNIPAIFIVDQDRKETLVNYHLQGDYVVVNTVAKQFTFRDGGHVTCVYNDQAIGDWASVQ